MTPTFMQSFMFVNAVIIAVNALFLLVTILAWRFADVRLLRRKIPATWQGSTEEIAALMQDERQFYRYSMELPFFVTQGLLWKLTPINSAPTFSSALLTLVAQSLPFVSMAVVLWYGFLAFVQLVTLTRDAIVKTVPAPVKRMLQTPLF